MVSLIIIQSKYSLKTQTPFQISIFKTRNMFYKSYLKFPSSDLT